MEKILRPVLDKGIPSPVSKVRDTFNNWDIVGDLPFTFVCQLRAKEVTLNVLGVYWTTFVNKSKRASSACYWRFE